MKVLVNGDGREINGPATVARVLGEIGVDDPRGVAVAVDGEVIVRSEWDAVEVREGQAIEILRAVQGGSGGVAAPCTEQLHTLEAAIPPR
jgi:sulfur carrier protein